MKYNIELIEFNSNFPIKKKLLESNDSRASFYAHKV